MRKSFSRGSRLDLAEQKIGARPDPNEAEVLRQNFDTIDLMVHLRDCGCKAASDALDFVMEHIVDAKDRSEKKRRYVERELVKLDKRVWKWQEKHPELWQKELMVKPEPEPEPGTPSLRLVT